MTDLSSAEAENIRDGLCRTLYSRLFTYIVSRINESIKVKSHRRHHVLGILDIYGFEAFQQNGFEQLLINYANEKLQQMFIENCFKLEQEEYLTEGVEWVQVGFFSNSAICSMIDSSNSGLFSLLDEFTFRNSSGVSNGANSQPLSMDQVYLDEINTILGPHPHYEPSSEHGDDSSGTNPVPIDSFRWGYSNITFKQTKYKHCQHYQHFKNVSHFEHFTPTSQLQFCLF